MKIEKIIIEMGKKKVELSVEEAKELRDLLNDTFRGEERIIKEKEYVPYYPYYPHPYTYYRWTVYSNATGDATAITGSTGSSSITYTLNQ